MIWYVVHNETRNTFFVGTGGQSGGSTAYRGHTKSPPKLYATRGRAQGALTTCSKYAGLQGDVIKVKPVELLIIEEVRMED